MFVRKTLLACLLAGACWLPQAAGAQPAPLSPDAIASIIRQCPGLRAMDPAMAAQIIQSCPGLMNMDPAQAARILRECPGLNGDLTPQAFAEAVKKCPALNGTLPPEQSKCPALNNPKTPNASNCPAFNPAAPNQAPRSGKQPSERNLAKKADARMQSVVKNLERNKRSAEALIQAAREAGADPNVVSDLEKMSQAFRKLFMSTVSPEQIVESIFAAPARPEASQGLVIVGPDGSRWLVTPGPQAQSQQKAQHPQQKAQQQPQHRERKHEMRKERQQAPSAIGRPGQHGLPSFAQPVAPKKDTQAAAQPAPGMTPPPPPGMMPPPPGMTPPPPPGMPQFMPPQGTPPQFVPPQGMPPQGMHQQGMPPRLDLPQGMVQPPAQQGQDGEVLIMEETVTPYMPLWPTKDQLGKDGVLNYLEKRAKILDSAI